MQRIEMELVFLQAVVVRRAFDQKLDLRPECIRESLGENDIVVFTLLYQVINGDDSIHPAQNYGRQYDCDQAGDRKVTGQLECFPGLE